MVNKNQHIMRLLILLLLISMGCNQQNYEGYVYDAIDKKPISGMQVLDLENGTKTTTDQKGYFNLKKNNDISSSLTFYKEPYYQDTISSIQIQNGERQKELFKREDIFILKKKARDSIIRKNGL